MINYWDFFSSRLSLRSVGFKVVCFSSKYLERSKKTYVFDRTANFLLPLFVSFYLSPVVLSILTT